MEASKNFFGQQLFLNNWFTTFKITKNIFYRNRKFKSKHVKFSCLLFQEYKPHFPYFLKS